MIRKLQDDLRCLGIAFFENIELNTNACFGSIGLDCKRPFGNSLVESDILDIIIIFAIRKSKDIQKKNMN